ncbi:MAG: lipopolysaccharide heptosyltransferase I [Betaproteobacteria bacterium RIFCSPLOWO2_02_FULL_67_26]|nr:MAG: lipopolysaccharide heptosyltransferase I [Betaproteobacteria bacterium RIFCSPLOWO2_02_FULL_67_26]
MKKILLVKTSSLGDVVHNLPVASDIRAAVPAAEIDWVVEESFAAIPRMHPAVARVLPVAIRRWRTGFLRAAVREEIRMFTRELQRQPYDAIIDTQGLVKSALVARAARGVRHGLDFASAREPLWLFYDRTHSVPWTMHAVERNRRLAAQALGYDANAPAEYGISARGARFAWLPGGRYAVLLHATSAADKLWDEARWLALGAALNSQDLRCVVPWGGPHERLRSERLAGGMPNAVVPPLLTLVEMAALMAGAAVVVGVDTGLTHIAGALGVPTVGIYGGPWDPAATGIFGCARAQNLGAPGRPPEAAEVIAAVKRMGA